LLYRDNDLLSEQLDICAMVLPSSLVTKNKDNNALFIKMLDNFSDVDGSEYAFALGYPHKIAEYITALQADGEYGLEKVCINQLRVHGFISSDLSFGLPYLELHVGDIVKDMCQHDLSGFSGGPVFSIHRRHKIAELRGIAVTAGMGRIRYIPTHVINEFLDGFNFVR